MPSLVPARGGFPPVGRASARGLEPTERLRWTSGWRAQVGMGGFLPCPEGGGRKSVEAKRKSAASARGRVSAMSGGGDEHRHVGGGWRACKSGGRPSQAPDAVPPLHEVVPVGAAEFQSCVPLALHHAVHRCFEADVRLEQAQRASCPQHVLTVI